MSDIASWLSQLGLSRYEDVFAEHDVDLEVLGDLTEADLAGIGVTLGHRKKMLKAIAASPAESSPATAGSATAEGEFRFLTVMFCDLVGSTALTARLGPEAMRDVNRTFQHACRSVVARFDGYLARYMGDGILVYFGFPAAQEDAAERALRTSLGILDAMVALNGSSRQHDDVEFAVRIGIATGRVVIDRIGEGGSAEDSAIGDAPNMAARLQGLAAPGCLVIGDDTRGLVGGAFEYEDIGEHALKGIAEPVRAWRVLRESAEDNRFTAHRGTTLGALVGRDDELGLLLSRWRQATSGEGQSVVLSGEAGIGKSRLIEALLERAAPEAQVLVRYYCSPFQQQSPLFPLIDRVKREAGLSPGDDAESLQRKIDALLRNTYGFASDALGVFTSLVLPRAAEAVPPEYLAPAPEQQLAMLQGAFTAHLLDRATNRPTLVVVEDAHWMDPTTRALLETVVEQAHGSKLLVLISSRPDGAPEYRHPHVTRLSLNRLGKQHVASLIGDISRKAGLSADVIEQIRSRCDGVPLYVEEITKMVMESGPGESPAVPDSLQASLLARLDRLGDAREIAQVASVVGNRLTPELLGALCGLDDESITRGLDELVEHDVLFRRGSALLRAYEFRHALLKDAAYGSLLTAKRRQLHHAIADHLDEHDRETAQGDPGLIAYHYSEAMEHTQAFGYWLRAGRNVLESGATLEAVGLLDRAQSSMDAGNPESLEPRDIYVLHMARGRALNAAHGAAAVEAHECFRRAAAAGEQIGELELWIDAVDWEFGITFNAGMLAESLAPAQTLIDIGQSRAHLGALISGYQGMAMAHFARGEFAQARTALENALRYRHDEVSGVNCYPSMSLTYLSYALFVTGDAAGAREACDAALDSARRESTRAAATALSNCCYTLQFLDDVEAVSQHAEELVELAEENGLTAYRNRGLFFRHWAAARRRKDAASLRFIIDAVDDLLSAREEIETTYLLGIIAELQMDFGQLDDARESLARAAALVEKNGERFYAAELDRLGARLECEVGANGAGQRAAALLDRAIETARGQGAAAWEARAQADREALLN